MNLKRSIEQVLKAASPTWEMDNLLKYMAENGFYKSPCSSHDNWNGGTAEHVWACYRIAISKWKEILKNKEKEYLQKYVTDDKLAIVCLLHDLCNMRNITVTNPSNNKDVSSCHGRKSYAILMNHNVGTKGEQNAVLYHMHENAKSDIKNPNIKEEYDALHTIICEVDHIASGVAWNCALYKKGLTQCHHSKADYGYMRSCALDRTKQCLDRDSHIYIDYTQQEHKLKGYNRENIEWNTREDIVFNLTSRNDVGSLCMDDAFNCLREADRARDSVLVVGVDSSIPKDVNKRLRANYRDEQDLLICSNILYSFYENDKRTITQKRHHYGFTMRDKTKQLYNHLSIGKGIYMPQVTFFRDADREGYRMVAPWQCDVLMVPGWKGITIQKK